MEIITPVAPNPVLASRPARWLTSLVLLAVALAMTVPIYGGWMSGDSQRAFRYGFTLLWGILALAAARSGRTRAYLPLLLSLFGVSLGFSLAYLSAHSPLSGLGGSTDTPKGAAAEKVFTEVIPISAAILFAVWLSRRSLKSLGLRRGKVRQSLGLGLLATLPLLALFALDPSGGRDAVLATPTAVILSWLPWIVLFSVANGFMEELWFRGLWLGGFQPVLGLPAATHVTSLAFALMHVIVYLPDVATVAVLTPAWLFMGYAYAQVMRKSGSLWGPVLAHTIADVLFLLAAFSAGKL